MVKVHFYVVNDNLILNLHAIEVISGIGLAAGEIEIVFPDETVILRDQEAADFIAYMQYFNNREGM